MNFGFIIDNRKCIGCHACTVACKAEHDVPVGVNRTWVKYIEKGEFPDTQRHFSVMRCNHCADAPCVEICPVTALFTRVDGIVDFDNRRCIGCRACMQACPYDALYVDPETHTAAKCNYCAHRVELNLEPACVNVCPEHAIISGDMDDPGTEIARLLSRQPVTARKTEKGTRPQLFYIEGEASALESSATSQSSDYMWSSQARGVGHYARYAQQRVEDSIHRQGEAGGGDEEEGLDVLIPNLEDPDKAARKAGEVVEENSRRVYDTPSEGVVWGWEVAAYVWTKSIATGVVLVPMAALGLLGISLPAGVAELALALALVFLALTGGLLVKDLDRPDRFLNVLLRPQWNSWLVRGAYFISGYGFLLVLWGLARWQSWSGLEDLLVWPLIFFALMTAVYTAFLFAQAKGRDFWQSPMMAVHMLAHSLLAGAACLSIGMLFLGAGMVWAALLRQSLLLGLCLNLAALLLELITPHPTREARAVAAAIMRGRFSGLFWSAVLAGGLIPLGLAAWGGTTNLALAGIMSLAGLYLIEHIWIRVPQMMRLS